MLGEDENFHEAKLALFTANLHILDARRRGRKEDCGINRDISRAEVRLDESNRSCSEGAEAEELKSLAE